jgi:hypothetical protein
MEVDEGYAEGKGKGREIQGDKDDKEITEELWWKELKRLRAQIKFQEAIVENLESK